MKFICGFKGKYQFLSNFYPATFYVDIEGHDKGHMYKSVEHYFQSMKTDEPDEKLAILQADTPAMAKRLGRNATLRPDWEKSKVHIMYCGLCAKFAGIQYLRSQLLKTEDAMLIEGNYWGDEEWGVPNNGAGKNMLGILLMIVRNGIRTQEGLPPIPYVKEIHKQFLEELL
jgi:ribA/ribD-fused uncharacterized protein